MGHLSLIFSEQSSSYYQTNMGMGTQLNLKQDATKLVALVQNQNWNPIKMHLKKSEAYYGVDYR